MHKQTDRVTIAAMDGWHCASYGEVGFASKAEAKYFFAKAQNEQQICSVGVSMLFPNMSGVKRNRLKIVVVAT